jgi:hypothetical protein
VPNPRVRRALVGLTQRVEWRAVKRRLFTILSALSLLLFVAVVLLWVRATPERCPEYGWVPAAPASPF